MIVNDVQVVPAKNDLRGEFAAVVYFEGSGRWIPTHKEIGKVVKSVFICEYRKSVHYSRIFINFLLHCVSDLSKPVDYIYDNYYSKEAYAKKRKLKTNEQQLELEL